MMAKTVQTMSLLGGHPVLDFVNTVDSRIGTIGPDYLQSYDDLLVWAGRTQLIDADPRQRLAIEAAQRPADAAAALSRAKALREALYRICCTEVSDRPVERDDLDLFDTALRSALAGRRLACEDGALEWAWRRREALDHIADRIAVAACDLLIESRGERRPIRQCPGRNCGWLFLDKSRGGRRHWCSDLSCGTPARVRKFRAE